MVRLEASHDYRLPRWLKPLWTLRSFAASDISSASIVANLCRLRGRSATASSPSTWGGAVRARLQVLAGTLGVTRHPTLNPSAWR